MGNIWLLKRALPFLATFGLGLFVASFFVDIGPRFDHHERTRCHHDMWDMRIENEQLRDENRQLREQLNELSIPPSEEETYNSDFESEQNWSTTVYPTNPPKGPKSLDEKVKAHKVLK